MPTYEGCEVLIEPPKRYQEQLSWLAIYVLFQSSGARLSHHTKVLFFLR